MLTVLGWAMGAQTRAQRWMSLMIGGISGCLLYLKGGAADGLSWSKFYTLFDPYDTSYRVSKPIVEIENKLISKSIQHMVFISRWSMNYENELLGQNGGEAIKVLRKTI